jgi:hypothetical protein
MRDGRLVHRMVSVEQARFLRRAIASYRRVLRSLRQWEAQSMKTAGLTFRRKRRMMRDSQSQQIDSEMCGM